MLSTALENGDTNRFFLARLILVGMLAVLAVMSLANSLEIDLAINISTNNAELAKVNGTRNDSNGEVGYDKNDTPSEVLTEPLNIGVCVSLNIRNVNMEFSLNNANGPLHCSVEIPATIKARRLEDTKYVANAL